MVRASQPDMLISNLDCNLQQTYLTIGQRTKTFTLNSQLFQVTTCYSFSCYSFAKQGGGRLGENWEVLSNT